jgi:hypothetical protein
MATLPVLTSLLFRLTWITDKANYGVWIQGLSYIFFYDHPLPSGSQKARRESRE